MDPLSIVLAVAGLLSRFAPELKGLAGKVLDDKAGAVAGKVLDIARVVTGETDPDKIAAHLAKVDADRAAFVQQLRALEIEEERVHAGDRADARGTMVKLAAAGHSAAWSAPILSAIILLSFAAMLYVVMTVPLPAGSEDVAMVMLGTLGAMALQVANYWLGSSKGSADKQAMLMGTRGGVREVRGLPWKE